MIGELDKIIVPGNQIITSQTFHHAIEACKLGTMIPSYSKLFLVYSSSEWLVIRKA